MLNVAAMSATTIDNVVQRLSSADSGMSSLLFLRAASYH